MSRHTESKSLVVLVPDADIEQSVKGLLTRTDSLKIAPVDFEVTRHVNRDSGCRASATSHLRPYLGRCRYALVVFDRHGCGSPRSRREIQQDVEHDLAHNGWNKRAKAVVIDPEIEAWVWSDSAEAAQVMGWGSDFRALRAWLASQALWPLDRPKPQDPKRAMRKAMEKAGAKGKARRSPSKFHDLATTVDFGGCKDPAFVELTGTLRAWFPPEAER